MGRFLSSGLNHFDESRGWNDSVRSGREAVHDTGIFDDDRYFDFVEYAKGSPEDLLIRVTAWNRGQDAAALHLLPTLWFRNIWSEWSEGETKPSLSGIDLPGSASAMEAEHAGLGIR